MQPDQTLIARLLSSAGIEASFEETAPLGLVLRLAPDQVRTALAALAESDHAYQFLVDLFGIDTGEGIDVVHHIRSFVYDDELHVKSRHEYGSTLESVWEIHPAALMPERECAEMFGLTLSGHPNPKRLLTTEQVPPLLLKATPIRTAEEVRNR